MVLLRAVVANDVLSTLAFLVLEPLLALPLSEVVWPVPEGGAADAAGGSGHAGGRVQDRAECGRAARRDECGRAACHGVGAVDRHGELARGPGGQNRLGDLRALPRGRGNGRPGRVLRGVARSVPSARRAVNCGVPKVPTIALIPYLQVSRLLGISAGHERWLVPTNNLRHRPVGPRTVMRCGSRRQS